VTPSPLHDDAAMHRLVEALLDIWQELDIKQAA
jgi:5-aminolevulinate synthase